MINSSLMKIKILTLLSYILIGGLQYSSFAQPRILTASVFDIAPWGYKDDQGKITGIEYEIIQAISKEIKEEIKINLVPYNRMIYQLKNGNADFGIFFRSKKSETSAEPLIKWGELDIIIISKKGTQIKDYKDIKKLKIAVRLGGLFDKKFDNDKTIFKVSQRDYAESISKLTEGKVDAVIGTAATLFYELKKQKVDINSLSTPFYLSKKEDWLHFSRLSKNKHKKEKLKNAVTKLIKDGTFNKIFMKYLPKKWQHH